MRAKRIFLSALFLVFFCSFGVGAEEIVGHYYSIHGDSPDGTGEPKLEHRLFGHDGQIYHLNLLPGHDVSRFHGKKVKVTPKNTKDLLAFPDAASIAVEKIEEYGAALKVASPMMISMPTKKKMLDLLVNFSDGTFLIDEPRARSLVTDEAYPLVKHQVRTFSYGSYDLETEVFQVDIGSKSKYDFNSINFLSILSQDAADAAENLGINLALYEVIFFSLNDSIGCCAWGGGASINIKGNYVSFEAFWIPAEWIFHQGWTNIWVIVHEMGHALFGNPHTCGPDNGPYSMGLCTMSGSWCSEWDPVWGCIPIGYNASYRQKFIPDDKIFVSKGQTSETFELSCFDLLPSVVPGYMLARIPAGVDSYGSAHYVDFQAYCRNGGYSDSAFAEGVVIYRNNLDLEKGCGNKLYDPNRDGNGNWNDAGTPIKPGDPSLDISQVASEAGSVLLTVSEPRTATSFLLKVDNFNPESGSLVVSLLPNEVYYAGAQWRVDGGPWQNSGRAIHGLPVGQHVVEAKDINGWVTPTAKLVEIKNGETVKVDMTYVLPPAPGIIQVFLGPSQAISAGARWRVNGGIWRSSGSFIENVPPGEYWMEFRDIAGWIKPADRMIEVLPGLTSLVEVSYKLMPPTPKVTSFQVNGGAASTIARVVILNSMTTANPTRFMASESLDFSGAEWKTYSASAKFTLSSSGVKTVYFKVKNNAGESAVASDSIRLFLRPRITSFLINDGAKITSKRRVILNNVAIEKPTHYMASQSPGFLGAVWKPYSTVPIFSLSGGKGVKTIYFKVKNAAGVAARVKDSIRLR